MEKEVVVFRLEFKDKEYIPDAQGMDSILRLVNGIIKDGGGALVLPETMTASWLQEKWDEQLNVRTGDPAKYHVDFKILGALKAVVAERVKIEFPDEPQKG